MAATVPLLVASAVYRAMTPPDFVAFLQVGQGDCTVVRSEGRTMLIDTGPASVSGDSWGRLVAPSLRRLGVDSVDLLVLTHPDADHNGNIDRMVKNIPVRQILASAASRGRGIAGGEEDRVGWLWGESRARLGRADVRFFASGRLDDDNSESVCVLVRWPGSTAVMTADAPASVESDLMALGWEPADLLKVGHHGSSSATSQAWLDWNSPRFSVVSCGRSNPFGHPSRQVTDRLRASGTEALTTSWDGTVVFVPTQGGFRRVAGGL